MFQSLLICFREGLEAFLVIAIATLYLRKSQHEGLINAVRWGLLVAVGGSAVLGVVLSQVGALSNGWAGAMALVAAATVIWCVVHMRKAGKSMGKEISARLAEASVRQGERAWWAVFVFTAFMISREGIEAATMIASLARNADARTMAVGGALGVLLAAGISLLWVRFGHKVNLGRFFRVTAWFMVLFAIQLLIYAVHEFTEGALLPGVDNAYWHLATEAVAEGWIGQLISLGLVIVPTAWLIGAHFADQRAADRALVA